jgi:hypothetical protein
LLERVEAAGVQAAQTAAQEREKDLLEFVAALEARNAGKSQMLEQCGVSVEDSEGCLLIADTTEACLDRTASLTTVCADTQQNSHTQLTSFSPESGQDATQSDNQKLLRHRPKVQPSDASEPGASAEGLAAAAGQIIAGVQVNQRSPRQVAQGSLC